MNVAFIADDEWAFRILKVKGELCLTDWSYPIPWGNDFLPESPEIEVNKILPDGKYAWIGVLGKDGIFDVIDLPDEIRVIEIAGWQDIEVLPDWGFE